MSSKIGIVVVLLIVVDVVENFRPQFIAGLIESIVEQSGQYQELGIPNNFSLDNLQVFMNKYKTGFATTPQKTQCFQDIARLVDAFKHEEKWAIQSFDSWGKAGNGLLLGHVLNRGMLSLCLKSNPEHNSSLSDYESQFCWLDLTLYRFRGDLNRNIRMGSCFPKSCNEAMLTQMMNSFQALALGVKWFPYVYVPFCFEPDVPYFSNRMEATSWIIIFTLIGIVLLGSIYDLWRRFLSNDCTSVESELKSLCVNPSYKQIASESDCNAEIESIMNAFDDEDEDELQMDFLQRKNTEKEPEIQVQQDEKRDSFYPIKIESKENTPGFFGRFLLAFSAITNTLKLFEIKKNNDPKQLTCLHGIRVLSTGWVVMGHTISHLYPNSDNPLSTYDMQINQPLASAILIQGYYAVDSFFVLSGLLLTYLFMYSKEKGMKLNWLMWIRFYVDRFIRLSPANFFHLFVIFWGINLHHPLSPVSVYQLGIDKICGKEWWYYLLYIQNFITTSECFGIDWYLANDMQFFWISPIFLVLFIAIGPWVVIIFTGLTIASFGISYKIIVDSDFLHRFYFLQKVRSFPHFGVLGSKLYKQFYVRPYCRVGAYFIGMYVGWLLYKLNCNVKLSKVKLLGLWFSGLLCIGVAFYLPLMFSLSDFGLNLFTASSHYVWSLGLAILIFLCSTGYGGIVDSFLSWPGWQPFSKLSYCVYLMHFISMKLFYFKTEEIFHLTAQDAFTHFSCLIQYDFVGALFLYLTVECPCFNLRKSLFK